MITAGNFRDYFTGLIRDRRVVISGFGKEGKSTYKLIRTLLPEHRLLIADDIFDKGIPEPLSSDAYAEYCNLRHCAEKLVPSDIVVKSPGIPTPPVSHGKQCTHTSQTDIFLSCFHNQVIGITGTKGKSTTTTLIHEILGTAGQRSLLAGNIGIPVFEILDQITADTRLVTELSAHQLQCITRAPDISVLLNIYQDHLDHFGSMEEYTRAKLRILELQENGATSVINTDQEWLRLFPDFTGSIGKRNWWKVSAGRHSEQGAWLKDEKVHIQSLDNAAVTLDVRHRISLPGRHNLHNIMAAACCASELGIDPDVIEKTIVQFKGLPHRMEYAGQCKGVMFYNDAIATIPEAAIEAVKALGKVDTLIAGGKDRGIDYSKLIIFLAGSEVRHLLLSGESGKRIYKEMEGIGKYRLQCHLMQSFSDFFPLAMKYTRPGHICLLSPASASYDEFRDFEEKGNTFKKIISNGVADDLRKT